MTSREMILDLLAKQYLSDVNVASLYGRMALEGGDLAELYNERERDRGGRNLAAWTEARAVALP